MVFAPEPLAYLGACPCPANKAQARIEPVTAGPRVFPGQDFNPVAGVQLVGQWNNSAIHLCTLATVTHFGVNVIGKIQHGRAKGQVDDLAGRCQYINTVFGGGCLEAFQQAFIIQFLFTGIQ